MKEKELVEKFQCPGCVLGSDTACGSYNFDHRELRCVTHVLGTQIGLGNPIALGLPKGFNKPGFNEKGRPKNKVNVRLFQVGTYPEWDYLNIPVWALEKDGFLFVRTFAPRIDCSWVDVVDGGTLKLCPNAINVAEFYNKID